MKQGIVIVTSESTKDFLGECINSCLQDKYPILVVSNNNYVPTIPEISKCELVINDWNGFELGGIVRGMERFDEFILMQDTAVVKDQELFDISFNYNGTVYYTDYLAFHYSAKFRTEILKKMNIPRVTDRREAIDMERKFGVSYLIAETGNKMMIEPPVPSGDYKYPKATMHGRKGIIVENKYIRKHKTNY